MSPTIDDGTIERFRDQIARQLGLALDEDKLPMLAGLLRERLLATGRASRDYLEALKRDGAGAPELAAIARAITVGETYFFRNVEQFRVLREVVLPASMRARAASHRLRFLSAGCASGEEAHSIAIAALEEITEPGWKVSIVGVDINPDVLAKAASGRFSSWSLRGNAASMQRWYKPDGREFVLDPAPRALVSFERVNLTDPDASIWQPDAYDAIFCRNVLMYFAPQAARAVVARLCSSLAPHGSLFLGHAEPMRGLSSGFHLRHTHDTFYYQRRAEGSAEELPMFATSDAADALRPALPDPDSSWAEVIHETSRRVATLSDAAARPGEPRATRAELAPALECLQRERFDEGLSLVDAALRSSGGDRQALLLQAVLLTHAGRIAEAEHSCRRLLEQDDLEAGAHYLLALCRENAGDREGAAELDGVAIYLDPTFAMPHFHLGMLARRGGDHELARRELGHAAILLEREDASRMLLFGGGFDRRALLALCAAELRACGGGA